MRILGARHRTVFPWFTAGPGALVINSSQNHYGFWRTESLGLGVPIDANIASGTYRIARLGVQGPSAGISRFFCSGVPINLPIDGYQAATLYRVRTTPSGTLRAGVTKCEIVAKNANSAGYNLDTTMIALTKIGV